MARPSHREAASPRRAAPADPGPAPLAAQPPPPVTEAATPLVARPIAALAAVLAALLVLAWLQRNIVADAFIVFRYSDHLVRGSGLVWNAGERVDAWVARKGTPSTFSRFVGGIWPVHGRLAPLDYLLEPRVNLFIGAGSLLREDLAGSRDPGAARLPLDGAILDAEFAGWKGKRSP